MERDEICKVLFTIIDNIFNNCIYSNFRVQYLKEMQNIPLQIYYYFYEYL